MKIRSKPLSKKTLFSVSATALAALVSLTGLVTFGTPANAQEYYVDKTHDEYVAESVALNQKIMEEGMVLLKNLNAALPLSGGAKVSLFGAGSYMPVWGETGGGNGKTDYCYLKDSLTSAGFSVNPELAAAYENASIESIILGGATLALQPDLSVVTAAQSSFSSYNDAAIVTISRTGKESYDLLKTGVGQYGWDNETDHQLMLNTGEKELIAAVEQNFSKVIILLNCASIMQIPELAEDEKISAVMYIGLPGQYGLEAVGNVLNGSVSPSGKTVSVWPSDFTKDPTYFNVGSDTDTITGTAGDSTISFSSLNYEEGIYLGYKYYETAAAENFIDYNEAVVYPFGYGLSYTVFSQEFVTDGFTIPDGATFDTYFDLQVKVKNTGSVAGKEVVQIYSHAPYVTGEIEKAESVLVGFAKTDTLQPDEEQTVTVSVRYGDIASFDWNDANGNGWYGYEIESATGYELRLQSDSHSVLDSISYDVGETVYFNNDGSRATHAAGSDDTSNLVFSTGDDFDSLNLVLEENGGNFVILSRADFAGTFPSFSAPVTYENGLNARYYGTYFPDQDTSDDYWYVESVPSDWTQDSGTDYTLYDMAGIDYTSSDIISGGIWDGKTGVEAWTAFMNQLTWDELAAVGRTGSHMTVAVENIGKPQQNDTDGPEQIGDGTFWACANIIAGTYNLGLAEERGVAMGNEALYDGFTGWYGPTANLNRSPFGGRNMIYFSEDALLAGKMSAATIRGAQSRGVIAYVKHFALNEQETNRTGIATWITEQALRETYLKAFEFTVKEGKTLGIMQSMNRVGAVNCYGNYALDVQVLRKEWGFLGGVITDSYSATLVRENLAQRMGGDFPLGSWTALPAGEWDASANMVMYEGAASPTQWSVIRNSAMHILYMAVNSNQMKNGYNTFAITNNTVDAQTFVVGQAIQPLDVSIDTEAFGTDKVAYSVSGLPDGLTIDPATGIITGTPTSTGTFKRITVTVSVTSEGEEWISRTFTFSATVEEESECISPDGGESGDKSGCSAGCKSAVDAGLIGGSLSLAFAAVCVYTLVRSKKKN